MEVSVIDERKPKLGLGAVLALCVVPLSAAVIWFVSAPEGRPPTPPETTVVDRTVLDARSSSGATSGSPGAVRAQPALRREEDPGSRVPRGGRSGEAPGSATSSEAAREDAERIRRFDDNAQAFDSRLEAFEREKSLVDEASSSEVQQGLVSRLEALHPGVRVSASCTPSVCIVDLDSDEPVGTMIARIAPFLRTSTSAATGDPEDPTDELGMRLAFEKSDALALIGQPSELLP